MCINKSFMLIIFAVILSCFLILTSLAASLSSSSDTLKQGDVLNSTSHLVSAGNNFTLEFKSLTTSLSNDTYLGIWFTNDEAKRYPVWVGNRNTPIQGNSGVLTIDTTGKLIIKHDAGEPIVLYAGQNQSNITATLLDNGNFVITELNSSGLIGNQQVLWQSFDHPTDTLLPGMKLGINHKTGTTSSLTSWFAEDLPALGAFTLDWDPKERQLVVKRRGVIYWTSGVLRGKEFEFVQQPDPWNYNYDFHNVTNQEEEYFTYTLFSDPLWTPEDRRVRGRWRLDYNGRMEFDHIDNTWFAIALLDLCYGYNTRASDISGGCELWEQPKCRNQYQKFDLRSGYFIPPTLKFFDPNKSLSLSDCRSNCWSNCDCAGFQSYGSSGCEYWNKGAEFQQSYSGDAPKQYVLISEPANEGNKWWVWTIVTVATSLLIVTLGLFYYNRKRKHRIEGEEKKRRNQFIQELTASDRFNNPIELEYDGSEGHDLKFFGFSSMVAATNNFSIENKLGQGGFGPVYKGMLQEGQEIAIKRLSRTSGQGLEEFKTELKLIAKLQHTHLVRILGCCIHGEEKMLIYEYMPNRSLDFFLFGTKGWIWTIVVAVLAISLLTLILVMSPGSLMFAIVRIFLFVFLLTLVIRRRKLRIAEEEKKRRNQFIQELTASDRFNNPIELEYDGSEGHDLKFFGFSSMVAATNNFSIENKLGQGGFGPVYKGMLQEGQEIAIKRLSRTSGQGLEEFKTELKLIAKLQHTHLVRILGCCIHGEEKMLIYEYMPNKSLDFFLFDPTKREMLDWEKRFNIIEGVTQGMLYLHKYSRMRVIHRDLKASNVLLDENMNPKIADFGMAKIFKKNETVGNTNRLAGTRGYMSPEYVMEGTFSEKSDIFSFGVLLLEIVSGRRCTSIYHPSRSLSLVAYAWELWKEGTTMELKDPILGDSCDKDQLLRTIHVGLLCVQESANDRPTMSNVLSMLINESMPSQAPKQPEFLTGRAVVETNSHESKSKACTVNEMSISIMEAR